MVQGNFRFIPTGKQSHMPGLSLLQNNLPTFRLSMVPSIHTAIHLLTYQFPPVCMKTPGGEEYLLDCCLTDGVWVRDAIPPEGSFFIYIYIFISVTER